MCLGTKAKKLLLAALLKKINFLCLWLRYVLNHAITISNISFYYKSANVALYTHKKHLKWVAKERVTIAFKMGREFGKDFYKAKLPFAAWASLSFPGGTVFPVPSCLPLAYLRARKKQAVNPGLACVIERSSEEGRSSFFAIMWWVLDEPSPNSVPSSISLWRPTFPGVVVTFLWWPHWRSWRSIKLVTFFREFQTSSTHCPGNLWMSEDIRLFLRENLSSSSRYEFLFWVREPTLVWILCLKLAGKLGEICPLVSRLETKLFRQVFI